MRKITFIGVLMALALFLCSNLALVGAQGPPDLTKFGFATVAKSMDIAPDQAATITSGDHSVAIKAGTFDNPVTFDLLTSDPKTWSDKVQGRTVRAAFAFRVTDKTTKAIVGAFKQPVTYSYSGKDAQSTDAILNITAATPPTITPNPAPITFDGKVNHPFTGAGVGWLVVSAPANAAAGATAPAAAATTPIATGTGGATTTTATLPKTGEAHARSVNQFATLALSVGTVSILAGIALFMRRRVSGARP